VIVGLLHPGEMGASVGAVLRTNGHEVVWASEGRSDATRARARGFRDAGSLAALCSEAELILSICPPHAALDVARQIAGFDGIYVDANAISPMRAHEVSELQARFVDGGIVGGPPDEPGTTLYLSGTEAPAVAALFERTNLQPRIVGDASAVKMVYAAWSKGTAALLLAIRNVAEHFGVEDERQLAAPELTERLARAERAAEAKGWRWIGEMEEIADTFSAAGQPDGFHRASAEVYRSS
jgi:3-hydroxyisobutyrate dehydrogenase-like beta-hydroxyacid dehydrogenase